MIGRCGFWGDILYSIGVTGFIYPIIGHWSWGPDGWLAALAFMISLVRPWCIVLVALFRWLERWRLVRAWVVSSNVMAEVPLPRTIWSLVPLVV